jgi:hypothetical protein
MLAALLYVRHPTHARPIPKKNDYQRKVLRTNFKRVFGGAQSRSPFPRSLNFKSPQTFREIGMAASLDFNSSRG